jgi:2-polyprenyl-3-methyl-5-hydroxy-6-metoxy-1,4-benzoquinol methylase
MDNFRKRLYYAYITKSQNNLVPMTLDRSNPRIIYLKQIVRRHFPSTLDASILDLGCGHGALIYIAMQMGYRHISGVDGSPEQVALAKQFGIDGIQHADVMETLGKKGNLSLDCVICYDLFEHFAKNELIPLVDSIYRVLKPSGRLILHTPNAESPFGMRIRYGDLTHELAFTRTSLGQLLLSSGFSKINYYEDVPVVHGLNSAGRFLLWKCFRTFLRLYVAAETGDVCRDAIFSQNLLAVAVK